MKDKDIRTRTSLSVAAVREARARQREASKNDRCYSRKNVVIGIVSFCLCVLLVPGLCAQYQIRYARGQDVSPTFQGWKMNADGTYTLYFGYFNRNSEEEVDIPIGPDNKFDGENIDQGQPTHFYPSPRWWVFSVVVPKDWPKDKRLVWTLTNRGHMNQAKAWLEPEWEVDQGIISKNSPRDAMLMTIGLGDVDFDNVAAKMNGTSAQTVKLGEPFTVTVTATDDGRPKPISAPGRQQGVRIRWIVYRGSGKVRFDPDIMSERIYGKPVTMQTKVTFSAPGNYRLRAIASDGQLAGAFDVDVTVSPRN